MTIQRMDHVGNVVDDLAAATAFLAALGLHAAGRGVGRGRLGARQAASAGGLTVKAIAMYLLKGTIFLGFSDVATLGGNAPTSATMQAQARVSLGRLP